MAFISDHGVKQVKEKKAKKINKAHLVEHAPIYRGSVLAAGPVGSGSIN